MLRGLIRRYPSVLSTSLFLLGSFLLLSGVTILFEKNVRPEEKVELTQQRRSKARYETEFYERINTSKPAIGRGTKAIHEEHQNSLNLETNTDCLSTTASEDLTTDERGKLNVISI